MLSQRRQCVINRPVCYLSWSLRFPQNPWYLPRYTCRVQDMSESSGKPSQVAVGHIPLPGMYSFIDKGLVGFRGHEPG